MCIRDSCTGLLIYSAILSIHFSGDSLIPIVSATSATIFFCSFDNFFLLNLSFRVVSIVAASKSNLDRFSATLVAEIFCLGVETPLPTGATFAGAFGVPPVPAGLPASPPGINRLGLFNTG